MGLFASLGQKVGVQTMITKGGGGSFINSLGQKSCVWIIFNLKHIVPWIH